MKNLLQPKWIFIIHTLPVILLFILFYNQYNVIKSLLTLEQKQTWLIFSGTLAGIGLISTAYAAWCTLRKRSLSLVYAALALVGNSAYLYTYAIHMDQLVPFNIPSWMLVSDLYMYPGTFLMPTLAHALFIMVVQSIPKDRKANPWLNFLCSLTFPLLAYIFINVIFPLWQPVKQDFWEHVFIVLFIAGTILFLFFISRGAYLLCTTHAKGLEKYGIFLKVIIAILLPLVGLSLNNGGVGRFLSDSNIFGDFSSPWFYVLAILNGVLLCMPKFTNHYARLVRFFALAICFPYILYFFFVFLPYLPLSVAAIIFIGVGFLMLTPLCLFIVQVNDIYQEFRFFSKSYSPKMILLTMVLGACLIPVLISLGYWRDKSTLTEALNYVYDRNQSDPYHINANSLQHTLSQIKRNKDRSTNNLPFLSMYYNWLVLDNLTLADTKIALLERIFLGETSTILSPITNEDSKQVKINNYTVESMYDHLQKAWTSTLNLTLKQQGETAFSTYETTFELPEGCWISDYYLYIGKRKEMGILAEKKAALWVFNKIRNENRDPGILHYLTGNKVAFKIFPFAVNETRTSGIKFIHRTPIALKIDDKTIFLGKTIGTPEQKIEHIGNATYIPAQEKTKLTLVQRRPMYHFIIDGGKGNKRKVEQYANRVESFLSKHSIRANAVNINFSNAYTQSLPFVKGWKTDLAAQQFEGGFFLEGAIQQILTESYQNRTKTFPVMIVVSDSLANAVVTKDFANLKIAYPENAIFYELASNGSIWTHALDQNPLKRLALVDNVEGSCPVYAWPTVNQPIAYLAVDGAASIVVDEYNDQSNVQHFPAKSWSAGLQQHALWIGSNFGHKNNKHTTAELVKMSMSTQIMSPATSFIVVENEAQKEALLKKQQEILAGNQNLDPDEDTQRMSEPNVYLLLSLLLAFIALRKHRKTKLALHCNDRSTKSRASNTLY